MNRPYFCARKVKVLKRTRRSVREPMFLLYAVVLGLLLLATIVKTTLPG